MMASVSSSQQPQQGQEKESSPKERLQANSDAGLLLALAETAREHAASQGLDLQQQAVTPSPLPNVADGRTFGTTKGEAVAPSSAEQSDNNSGKKHYPSPPLQNGSAGAHPNMQPPYPHHHPSWPSQYRPYGRPMEEMSSTLAKQGDKRGAATANSSGGAHHHTSMNPNDAASIKRARTTQEASEESRQGSPNEHTSGKNDAGKGTRQPVISPSSSDEAQTQLASQPAGAPHQQQQQQQQRPGMDPSSQPPYYPPHPPAPFGGHHHPPHVYGQPHHPAFLHGAPAGPYPPQGPFGYPPGPPGYHHPPMPFYGMMGGPGAPGSYPPQAPPPHGHAPPPPPSLPHNGVQAAGAAAANSSSNNNPEQAMSSSQQQQQQQPTIGPAEAAAAVALTESAAMSFSDHRVDVPSLGTSIPSAKRCVPLKHPMASRAWGQDSDAESEIRLPDFSQLVNFPDFLARGRGFGEKGSIAADPYSGKKHCVMCGQLRVCSVSSSSSGRKGGSAKQSQQQQQQNQAGENGPLHIIPRQNKGVCTACDVTVWAVVDQESLQIKWCKGCKNFRPWVAFGEKGMATKCVRCRTRQKEKYAAAKANTGTSVVKRPWRPWHGS